ncbi:MAG: hypothetical protein FJY83_01190 [Candidatus Aminicenantes bacterium]|nr:hypothetical protein [Candidatus Aminicenantes bacterium]
MTETIRLNARQYEDLLKLVYLGNFVVNNFRSNRPVSRFDDLESYLFALAKDYGLAQALDMDAETGVVYPSQEFSQAEELNEYLDDFLDNSFWDEIVQRLTSRDLYRKHGQESVEAMSWEEIRDIEEPIRRKYASEIEKHGLENLEIVNRKAS